MTDPRLTLMVAMHTIDAAAHAAARRVVPDHPAPTGRDRGAISLEQVLWFVAAGVSVAVVAAIIWNQIREQANTPIEAPSAP